MPWLRNIRGKLSSLFIKGSNRTLDGVNLPFLEERLAALAADPGWYGIERQVVSVPIDMKGHGRAFHYSSAVKAFHCRSFQRLPSKSEPPGKSVRPVCEPSPGQFQNHG